MLSVLLICSCKDDDEVVLSTDCYISSFTLGNVKRQITTVNSAGRDTTYTISYSALYFPMTVNQLDGTIANKDSLPVNSDVKAVLATVESSGTVVYKKVSEGDDAWKAYSTSDSIDFTSPLTFRVYSPDYSASRDYTLQVNVHQQDGEVFSWEKVAEPAVWSVAEAVKTVVWKGRVWLYSKENGSVRERLDRAVCCGMCNGRCGYFDGVWRRIVYERGGRYVDAFGRRTELDCLYGRPQRTFVGGRQDASLCAFGRAYLSFGRWCVMA